MHTIYFAGPLFTMAERNWNKSLADTLIKKGYNIKFPQELPNDVINEDGSINNKKVFEKNKEDIDNSDVVIAILDGADADSGTCWECGYAYAKGKKVIGIRTDFRKCGDDERGVNLMLAQSVFDFIKRDAFDNGIDELSSCLQKALLKAL